MLSDETRLRGDGALAYQAMRAAGIAPDTGQDWFDGARLIVEEGTPAYRYAEEIVEIESCN
jgi:hypothetical protein